MDTKYYTNLLNSRSDDYKNFKIALDEFKFQLNELRDEERQRAIISTLKYAIETDIENEREFQDVIPINFQKTKEEELNILFHSNQIINYCEDFLNQSNENELQSNSETLNWIGDVKRLSAFISFFIETGYIEAKRKSDNEVNYTELARRVIRIFRLQQKEKYIADLLNPESDRFDSKFSEKLKKIPKANTNL